VDANPALWADVERDIEIARRNAESLARRAESLERRGASMDPDVRLDRQIAVGQMLHNCYGGMESALERLVLAIDGSLPTGSAYHADLIRRATAPVPGVRSSIIGSELAADLDRLRRFRHAYGDYDYARAAENVPIAVRAVAALIADLAGFAHLVGLIVSDPSAGKTPPSA
jgi:hypothetical protein